VQGLALKVEVQQVKKFIVLMKSEVSLP